MRLWPALVLFCTLLLEACSATPAASPSPVQSAPPASPAASTASAKPAGSVEAAAGGKPVASGKPAASPSGSISAVPGKLNITYAQISASFLPLYYATDQGTFKKNGIDAATELAESSTGIAALLSGQIDMAITGGTELLDAASQGADVVAIGNLVPVYTYELEVTKDINSAADLKGKKVGITRFGSVIDVATRVALNKLGLTDKDVTILQLGSVSARTDALLNGAIQGGLSNPPESLTLEDHGFHPVVDLVKTGAPATTALVVARGSWIASHRDQAQRVIDSLAQAAAAMKANKATTENVLKKYLKYDDPKGLDATYDFFVNNVFHEYPDVTPEMFKDVTANPTNPAVKGFDPSKAIDDSFVKNAQQRGVAKA